MQGNAADNASPERATDQRASSPARRARHAVLGLGLVFLLLTGGGCATIRTTDPPRTATEQFLLTTATAKAIEQLSAGTLRDRTVWVESAYLSSALQPTQEQSFLLGELRAKLLASGVRLAAA